MLGKQLSHSDVEGVEKVGVGGGFLIKSAFLIKITVCTDPEDTCMMRKQDANIQGGTGYCYMDPQQKQLR